MNYPPLYSRRLCIYFHDGNFQYLLLYMLKHVCVSGFFSHCNFTVPRLFIFPFQRFLIAVTNIHLPFNFFFLFTPVYFILYCENASPFDIPSSLRLSFGILSYIISIWPFLNHLYSKRLCKFSVVESFVYSYVPFHCHLHFSLYPLWPGKF